MKQLYLTLLLIASGIFISCIDVEERDNNNIGNFEALWSIIDQKYCFFDYKGKEYGLDWNKKVDEANRKVLDWVFYEKK